MNEKDEVFMDESEKQQKNTEEIRKEKAEPGATPRSAAPRSITEEDRNRGRRIACARKEAELTQEQLAQKLGLTQSTITAYETGRSDPKSEGIANIARACRCSTDYLLGLSPYMDTFEEGGEAPERKLSKRAKKIARDFDYLRQPEQDLCEAFMNYLSEISRPSGSDPGRLYYVREKTNNGDIILSPVRNYFKDQSMDNASEIEEDGETDQNKT